MTIGQYLPASILLLGTLGSVVIRPPSPTPLVRPLTATMPATFFGVPGKEIPIGEDERKASGVTDYIMRGYDVGTPLGPVTLYVGYHATQRGDNRMHSPSLCLPGAGWTPVDSRVVKIPYGQGTASVNRFILRKGGAGQILVYYWFQGRGRITAAESQLKLNALIDAITSHRDEEALVRVMVPLGDLNIDAPVGHPGVLADTLATRLTTLVIPAMQQSLPPA